MIGTRILVAACLLASAIPAFAETYNVDNRHTHVTWGVVRAGMMMFHGKLVNNKGHVMLDPAAQKGEVDISMDMSAVMTGIPALDRQLVSPTFFNVAQFPEARFVANQVAFKGAAPERIDGTLTLLGVSKPLTLTVTRFVCTKDSFKKDYCGADATGDFKRSEFGMDKFMQVAGDDIRIEVGILAYLQ